ncbi:uncharacterized protein LOC121368982 isoform X2 [Gigantopelta aegis]|uniref:uncharacterized protein LOC121368982 isoform X2 n=1 Tax=Gigantopelta aegis TaxID=1735272 RepID=UPI001B8876C1|nr:uncharacterized protein LOC121368982 isoform X2 [Gigantopelta aegis]
MTSEVTKTIRDCVEDVDRESDDDDDQTRLKTITTSEHGNYENKEVAKMFREFVEMFKRMNRENVSTGPTTPDDDDQTKRKTSTTSEDDESSQRSSIPLQENSESTPEQGPYGKLVKMFEDVARLYEDLDKESPSTGLTKRMCLYDLKNSPYLRGILQSSTD